MKLSHGVTETQSVQSIKKVSVPLWLIFSYV